MEELFNSFLERLHNDSFFDNIDYIELIKKKSETITDKKYLPIYDILINLGRSDFDKVIRDTQNIDDCIDDLPLLFLTICRIHALIRYIDINITEFSAQEYSKICKQLENKLIISKYTSYLWIPPLLTALLYIDINSNHALLKIDESIELAKKNNYDEFPLSYAYDKRSIFLFNLGYFDRAITNSEEAFKKWPTSTYLRNNLSYFYYITKDEKAYDYLKMNYENSSPKDPYGPYNLALYKLFNHKLIDNINDVPVLFRKTFLNFINNFKVKNLQEDVIDIIAVCILNTISKNIISNIDIPSDGIIDDDEKKITEQLLVNLFASTDNFLTETFIITNEFHSFLSHTRTIDNSNMNSTLTILKRWSSFTPLIPKDNSSRGGGHFLIWNHKGIVIDPGPSFLENFSSKKFHLSDIDCIICSHGHIDHTLDLERIITLLYEQKDCFDKVQRITLILSPGVASKYVSLISSASDVIERCIVLYEETEQVFDELGISIKSIHANHKELFARSDTALAFIISLIENKSIRYRIGFTNDTGIVSDRGKNTSDYDEKLISFFSIDKLDLLVANIGSISLARLINISNIQIDETWKKTLFKEKIILKTISKPQILSSMGYKSMDDFEKSFFEGTKLPEYNWYKTHLDFRGIFKLSRSVNYDYIVITEYGEELKEYRHLITKTLNDYYKFTKIITGDVGTSFKFTPDGTLVYCFADNSYKKMEIAEGFIKNDDCKVIQFEKAVISDNVRCQELYKSFGQLTF
jgi:ribonuclease BN (tRNA processing enzyme)/tetratricopeptide (TPR) repeat protein